MSTFSAVHFRDCYRTSDSCTRQRRSRNSRTIVAFAFNLSRMLLIQSTYQSPVPLIPAVTPIPLYQQSRVSRLSAAWVPFASSVPWVRKRSTDAISILFSTSTRFPSPSFLLFSIHHRSQRGKNHINSRVSHQEEHLAPLLIRI